MCYCGLQLFLNNSNSDMLLCSSVSAWSFAIEFEFQMLNLSQTMSQCHTPLKRYELFLYRYKHEQCLLFKKKHIILKLKSSSTGYRSIQLFLYNLHVYEINLHIYINLQLIRFKSHF